MTRVIACGGLTIDVLQTSAGRSEPSLGGNAAYAAVGAWLAGADAEVVAVIGDDYPEELLTMALTAAGIGIGGVRLSPGPSFRVLLDESGPRRTVSYLPGSGHNDRLDPLPSQLPPVGPTDGVHVCAIPPASQRAMLNAVNFRAAVTTLDTIVIPGEIEPEPEELIDLARLADVFIPSRDEVEHHWPGPLESAIDMLVAAGCRRVVIKLGSAGSMARDEPSLIRVPAVAADVADPTGAGDSFCGAVCARLAAGDPLLSAMQWGSAAASVVIEGHGAAHALSSDGRSTTAARAKQLGYGTLEGAA